MQVTRPTSSTREEGIYGATLQRTRWWETTYTTVSWDYPPSPAAYHDALLSRGASHSRFLRIAHLSTRHGSIPSASCSPLVSHSSTSFSSPLYTPTSPSDPPLLTSTTQLTPDGSHRQPALHLPPMPAYSLSRSCVTVRPRSANPMAHTLKRRKPQWPKPPHYHAALLRSPLSHRKGLFRAVLPPNKAVDFFRWDVLVGAGVSWSASYPERDWTRAGVGGGDACACASEHIAESVLAPYEAAAGFFGWHGLGLGVARHVRGSDDDGRCWGVERGGARKCRLPALRFEIDEVAVEEGREEWARTAEELVGPPGLVLRSVVEDGASGKFTQPSSNPAHKDAVVVYPSSSTSSRRGEMRWDSDTGSRPLRPPRAPPPLDEKQPSTSSGSKPEPKSDSPSAWWYGPSPHRGPPPPPHAPLLRFLPPPSIQYGPPPVQFSPWFPGGRIASAQGQGYWYGAQPIGTPPAKSLPPHSHVFATPAAPASLHSSQSPRHPTKPILGRDEYGPGHDYDKEVETDHGYESTTTTTDSDPPPHTPIGATMTTHCIEVLQLHGDDEVDVHGVDIDEAHAAASVTVRLSDPSVPVKLLDRFAASMSMSPSLSAGSPCENMEGCESSEPKAAVVFPSLNGSFCQGSSSQTSVPLSSPGMSAQTTPARTVTPNSSVSLPSKASSIQTGHGGEEVKRKGENPEVSVSGDDATFTLSVCSPPLTNPNPALRKDSQGFWEPVTPISPCSSLSSLPLSPSEGKTGSRPIPGWIGDKTRPVLGGICASPESASSPSTLSAKSRSLSPGPGHVISAGSTRSSSSQPASFSSPTSTSTSASASLSGGSYPSSPSPPNGSSLTPPNPTNPNTTTLLPAFLATATVKRKKASRTREIVDRLRSSSMDAGKGCGSVDGLGWLGGSSPVSGEAEGKLGNVSPGSEHVGSHITGGQPSPPSSRSQSDADSARAGSDSGKEGQATGSKSFDAGTSGWGVKSNGTSQATVSRLESHVSHTSPRGDTMTANPSITPFPILSVSQNSASHFSMTRQSQPVTATPLKSASVEGLKMNANVVTSPTARSAGPQLVPNTPNGGTLPSARPCHHPLPSPSRPTTHPPPALGPPPPILAVSAYPHPPPMYVPFTQYHIAPPHQGQQGQGWVAVYPGHPPHTPVHPLPVPPITGASGMRHVSW